MAYKNIEDRRAYQREWEKKRRTNSDRKKWTRNYDFKNRYKITLEEYNEMFEKQNGLCSICNNPETRKTDDKINLLSVDHCHDTGKIRGLLCNRCNRAIGLFKDDTDLLNKAIKYLEK